MFIQYQTTLTFESVEEQAFILDRLKQAGADWTASQRSDDLIDLPLTVRSYRCLKDAGFVSISAVVKSDITKIRELPNLGAKSFREIASVLIEHGYVVEKDSPWRKVEPLPR